MANARHLSLLICAVVLTPPLARCADPAVNIELNKIVLYNSGVGYFEHSGSADGNGHVELLLGVESINDVLKSVVLEDEGGQVGVITYEPRRPAAELLSSFAIDLTSNPTLGDLLHQLRGHEVQLDAPQPIEGTIVGIEARPTKIGETQVLDIEVLNLRTATGLRSIPLSTIVETRFPDARLNDDFQRALDVLAQRKSRNKKTITVNFRGEGQRKVRLGYVQESPVWKISYRLVIKPNAEPLLQGWAIVENTTDADWQNVDLTLVSGRPVSFIMNLDQPLYIARPLVEPESFEKLKPKAYEQDLAARESEFRRSARQARGNSLGGGMGGMGFGGMGGGFFGGSVAGQAAAQPKARPDPIDPSKSVTAVAQGDTVGELFRYEIEAPVSLARQHSAMLPIVSGAVRGAKTSIYNQAVHGKHPMDGFRLANSTDVHLMAGPITVFDEGAYAGDARIEDIAPGGERLISYALDLDTEIVSESAASKPIVAVVKISAGTMTVGKREIQKSHYTIKNSGKDEKAVLVEHPIREGWDLKAPNEPLEKTRSLYRFAVAAPPGEPQKLDVVEDRITHERVAVATMDEPSLKQLAAERGTGGKIRDVLGQLIEQRQAIAALEQQLGALGREVAEVATDQSRIRQNMVALDKGSDLYRNYVKVLAEQETELQRLKQESAGRSVLRANLAKKLDEFTASLDVQ